MVKKIGLSCIIIFIMAGFYGCSCSQKSSSQSTEPGVYISNVTVNEGDANPTITVSLQRDNQDKVTVNYEIIGITSADIKDAATPGVDFKAVTAGTAAPITFDPSGSNTQSIPLNIIDDALYEHNESFLVKLTSASGANIISGEAVVTIQDNDPKPVISLAPVDTNQATSVKEDAGQIPMTLSLDAVSGVDATVTLAHNSESATDSSTWGTVAAYRSDYIVKDSNGNLVTGDQLTVPAGQTSITINVDIVDDGIVENTEKFSLSLSNPVDAQLGGNTQTFSIEDNDAVASNVQLYIPLNDTGVIVLGPYNHQTVQDFQAANSSTYASLTDLYTSVEGELDKSLGRDAEALANTLPPKTGGGQAGFDFTKLDSSGNPTNAVASSDSTVPLPWDCVKDNNTGLVWEVKTRSNEGLRAPSRNLYWYNPDYATNGSVEGEKGSTSCDATSTTVCSTAYYIADINDKKLCGYTGWRLPTLNELRSIIDYNNIGSSTNVNSTSIGYDTNYFAGDTSGTSYVWTSDTYVSDPTQAWTIKFGQSVEEQPRAKANYAFTAIRLVNDSLIKKAQK